jgi:hypothetical protein
MVSEQRIIAADPQTIFDILADPDMHPVVDGSGSVRAARPGNPARLSDGATFSMRMHLGAPYLIRNTVVEFDEGRRIAWRHFYGHVWRYLLEPVDAGTLVVEQWDPSPARSPRALRLSGFPSRNRRGMRRTLERLDEIATGRSTR